MVKEIHFPTLPNKSSDRYNITPYLYSNYPTSPKKFLPTEAAKEFAKTLFPATLLTVMLAAVHSLSPNPDLLKPESVSNQPVSQGWYKATDQIEISTLVDTANPRRKIAGTISATTGVYCQIYKMPDGYLCGITFNDPQQIRGYTTLDRLQLPTGN